MDQFDLLTAPSLYLVDVRIKHDRVEAGLVWAGEGLNESAELFHERQKICTVRIPEDLQQLQLPTLSFYPSAPVELLRI
jgi:hypothetical protein